MGKENYDILFVGFAVNPEAAGKNNKYYSFLDSIGAKFLYNVYYETYTTEPMALLHLAAQVKKNGFKTDVIDGIIEGLSKQQILDRLIHSDCNVFAFTLYDTSEDDVIEMMRELKKHKPDAIIMTGGTYATVEYEKILKKYDVIDYITIGDGDHVYSNFLKAINNNESPLDIPNLAYRLDNGDIKLTEREVVNLDDQAFTDRKFAQQVIDKGFSIGVNTSRGCAHGQCAFCYLKDYQTVSCQPHIRYRSPEKVVEELKYLVDTFHINKVTFCDDDFFGTNKEGIERACKICKLIIENNLKLDIYVIGRIMTAKYLIHKDLLPLMKEAGINCIYLGFDSYNDDILLRYQKGCKVSDINEVVSGLQDNDIRINPGLITFEPILTIDHVKKNVELFKMLGYYDAYMFTRVLVILPQMRKKYFNDQEIDIYDEQYFIHKDTKILYDEMTKYLDMVLPFYRAIDKDLITDEIRQRLYKEHYDYFDYVYGLLKNNQFESTEEYLKECKNRISGIVSPIMRGDNNEDANVKKFVYQKQK